MTEDGSKKAPQVQTVADYLAKPTGASAMRRIGDGLAALCLVCLVAVGVFWAFQSGVFADCGVLLSESLDLQVAIVPLMGVGAALAVLAIAFQLVARFGGFSKHDDLGAVKRGVLAVMLGQSKYGISERTPMNRVALNAEYLFRGAGVGAIRCWNGSVPFMPHDFVGCNAAEFGGEDFMVVGGELYVFSTVEAKRRFIEAQGAKGGSAR